MRYNISTPIRINRERGPVAVSDKWEMDAEEVGEEENAVWEEVNGVTFYKEDSNNLIWWVEDPEDIGTWAFSFDQQEIFYMFQDYPDKLTPQQKEIFDRENPYWAEFFKNRT